MSLLKIAKIDTTKLDLLLVISNKESSDLQTLIRCNDSNADFFSLLSPLNDDEIKSLAKILKTSKLKFNSQLIDFESRNFEVPCPNFIKHALLKRLSVPNATWIETGTYMGESTEILIQDSKEIYSLEPMKELYDLACLKFKGRNEIKLINGTSEQFLDGTLKEINGDINFWLDGHHSEGNTFKGDTSTPIIKELETISLHLSHFQKVTIFIDDARCFSNAKQFEDYPKLNYLVEWSNANNLYWEIKFDIFIARNFI